MKKVDWHKSRYQNVRTEGLYIHKEKVNNKNFEILKKYTTVFISVDNLESRREIQKKCNEMGIFHLSVGIGVEMEGENDNLLGGMIKIEREYQVQNIEKRTNSELKKQPVNDVYKSNIQTVELNMLGAALAIVEWKIKKGLYRSDRTKNYNVVNYATPSGKILMG